MQDNYNDFQYGWPHFIGGVYNHNGIGTIEYQTGVPGSISSYKALIRRTGAAQRQADMLFAMTTTYAPFSNPATFTALYTQLLAGRRALGLVQHHGADCVLL